MEQQKAKELVRSYENDEYVAAHELYLALRDLLRKQEVENVAHTKIRAA